ncbi:MAG: hypothetical protein ACREJC_14435 [Tepidisphaeraceae bacterium]
MAMFKRLKFSRLNLAVVGAVLAATSAPARADFGGFTGVTIVQHAEDPRRDDSATRAALARVNSASSEIARVVAALRSDFDGSAETRDARDAVNVARKSWQAARDDALAQLRASSEYRQLRVEIDRSAAKLDAARSDPRGPVAQLARDLLEMRGALSKLEHNVLQNDPGIAQVRYDLIDASAKLAALERSFAESIRNDSRYLAAKSRLDAARQGLTR